MKELLIQEVEQLAYGLGEGDSLSGQLCPKCKGGRGGEHSFSVSVLERGKIGYLCHRASCRFRGVLSPSGGGVATLVPPGGSGSTGEAPRRSQRGSRGVPSYDLRPLPPDLLRSLCDQYNLCYTVGARYLTQTFEHRGSTYVVCRMPPSGTLLARRVGSKGNGYKSFFLNERNPPFIFSTIASNTIVIVEDIYSSLRLSTVVDSMCLTGTNISNNEVLYIATSKKYNKVVISLDKDANSKAIDIANKLKAKGVNVVLKILRDKDIKDMDTEEFEDYVRSV